ncbi:YceI family protein [Sorangium sp. So ce1024]|uniref:YceI family protein n=1 Tax=Sorangium sp. So ce1024 TaxID=3133327 RepID=UPI003F0250EA
MNTTTTTTTTPNAIPSQAARWTIDPAHSGVSFSVRHMMISNVRGELEGVAGDVTYDPRRPEATQVSATIDAASIRTRNDERDAHLRSADFLDVARHPAITFVSTSVRRRGDGLDVVGDLTIRGVSREVTLAVSDLSGEHTDPYGNRRLGATAATKIRRSDFGVSFNAVLETGGVLVGDEIAITLDIQLIKQG